MLNTVDPAIKLTTYRIVQEGLTNIQKHSQVKRASVILRMADDKLEGEIIDEGIGFDPVNYIKFKDEKGMGILSMKERAILAGGTFEIMSKAGEGTRIKFVLPAVNKNNEEVKK